MRCPKPMTLLTLTAGAVFAAVLTLTVTRPVVVEASAAPASVPQAPARRRRRRPRSRPPQAPATPAAGYIGAEACATCHTGYDASINASKHGQAKNPRTPGGGDGLRDLPWARRSARERSGKGQADAVQQALGEGGDRDLRHLPQPRRARAVERQPARGAQRVVRDLPQRAPAQVADGAAEVDQPAADRACRATATRSPSSIAPGHMPVREGKMECSSCHNPHGSTNVRLLKTGNSINESCATCHAEKRGPFLFEHAGVSGDSCATCHDPHGSNNDRMLVAKLPFLCQRCHNHTRHPSTIYDNKVVQSSNRLFSRSLRDLPLGDSRLEPPGRARRSCGSREAIMRNTFSMAAALRAGVTPRPRARRIRRRCRRPPIPVEIAPQRIHRQVVRHGRLRRPHHQVDGDEARFQRYRDLRPRRLRHQPAGRPAHRGLERRGAGLECRLPRSALPGRLRSASAGCTAAFLWDQIPLFISRDTRTLYTADRARRVPASRTRCSSRSRPAPRRCAISRTRRCRFDLRTLRSDRPGRRGVQSPIANTDLWIRFRNTTREGAIPFGAHVRFQQRRRTAGADRHAHDRRAVGARVGQPAAACCGSAGTDRRSTTTSTP